MSKIMIRCPESGSQISTGIDCDGATFDLLPFVVSHAHCPKCGKQHSWSKSDAWLSDIDSPPLPRNVSQTSSS
jgi:hypothetical protein